MSIGVLHGQNGGGKGADLTVTAPVGSTVTVSKDGKSKTKVAGSDGIVVFKGLQSGTWTLTSTDGTQTASKTVEIVADYATSITFFAATINITYPAGSTCKATNGKTTLTAPDTSGTWACVVPNAGTWTVTATKGSLSKSSDVSITTNGQSASVTLSYTLNLFASGNQYTSTTGGWSVTSGYGDVGSSVINLYTGENGQNSIAGTKNLVDISDFSTLNVTVTAQSGSCYARVVDSSGTTLANISISGTGTKMLDISSLSTAAYIRVGCSGTSSSQNTNLKVSNVWLS